MAHAFHEVPGVRVIVLFPIAEVSESQRKLMTTLNKTFAPWPLRGSSTTAKRW